MRRPLVLRIAGLAILVGALAAALSFGLTSWLGRPALAAAIAVVAVVPLALALAWRLVAPMRSLFRALAATVGSYRDGDFNFSLSWPRRDELSDLVDAHNALGDTLRDQRAALVERELLLDTMVQQTPVAMVLSDARRRIVYANIAARQLLGEGKRLEGRSLPELVAETDDALREAIDRGGDGLFLVRRSPDEGDDEDDTYHLARRRFRLSGRDHELLLLRRLTAELRRQEVATWKKVIRVISHELNNSLAPIASLARSGGKLLDQGRAEDLAPALATIEERARNLDQFIRGYARFAKLPAPQREPVSWPAFVEGLRRQIDFELDEPLPESPARVDPAQLEQALLNVLKNAHESGSDPADVRLSIREAGGRLRIDITDRGKGVSDAVMQSALLPFYSTKRDGTGLGLALSREIAEAHGGRVSLARRDDEGLRVTITLPNRGVEPGDEAAASGR